MNPRKPGPNWAVIMAVVLTVSSLTLVSTSAVAAPSRQANTVSAISAAECPSGGVPAASINYWAPLHMEYGDRGVIQCQSVDVNNFPGAAVLTIVDLAAGAKLGVVDEYAGGDNGGYDTLYNKYTAEGWFNKLSASDKYGPAARLFGVMNAAFFVHEAGSVSALSMPEWSTEVWGPRVTFKHKTLGWAYGNQSDPAWDAPKRKLSFGTNRTSAIQTAGITSFPTSYTALDVANAADCSNCYSGTVGFAPEYADTLLERRRTYVGTGSNKVYILTTPFAFSPGEATAIVQAVGASSVIQLDGGGSTQMESKGFSFESTVGRAVPSALAVYLGP